jgi:hypothetical protein
VSVRLKCVHFALLFAAATVHGIPVTYAIGPDINTVPRGFNQISNSVTGLFDLGDGSAGFDGGITYNPSNSLFYAIANDGLGNSTLDSFSLGGGGNVSPVISLGQGFLGGLTYDFSDGNLYAVSTDFNSGHSSFDQISIGGASVTPLFDLGSAFGGLFIGGLTFDSNNGLFYAMSADINGVSRVFNAIDPGNNSVTPLFTFGDGSVAYNGGLLFNPGDGLFYLISNDGLGNSTLNSFDLGGGGNPSPVLTLGSGFSNVGLTQIPGVPEPSARFPMAAALIALAAAVRRFKSKSKERTQC